MGGCSKILAENPALVLFCHISMAMEFFAFSQTEITKLRLWEAGAALILFVYTMIVTNGDILDCHAAWSLLHVVVNVFRLISDRIRAAKAMSHLTPEEVVIKSEFFPNYSNIQYVELKSRWNFKILNKGDVVCSEGRAVEHLSLVYSGLCQVTVDERFLGSIGKGRWVGEMAFFTGEPASATVLAQNNVCLIQWPVELVRRLAHSHRHTACAQAFAMLPMQFCRDLADKLETLNRTLDETLNEEEEKLRGDAGSDELRAAASTRMEGNPKVAPIAHHASKLHLPKSGSHDKRSSVHDVMKIGAKVTSIHHFPGSPGDPSPDERGGAKRLSRLL